MIGFAYAAAIFAAGWCLISIIESETPQISLWKRLGISMVAMLVSFLLSSILMPFAYSVLAPVVSIFVALLTFVTVSKKPSGYRDILYLSLVGLLLCTGFIAGLI